ncbi:unnamed protein product [Notodromas monacha]|uniref:Polo kinase n=1 Tax=Notodromas monacha TaxID=399045 RepID=A0A7R9GD19_9CRUS|nr:unnamed protein product [Notodromas monacha]CAG0916696.1 unnamed protein product [Notodromas monacha]
MRGAEFRPGREAFLDSWTICGTPNYIAPEVLGKMGHSYQADIWAIGCIMYAMLVGQPPFETATLKETYFRITMNKYCLPLTLSTEARNLIARLLHPVPTSRPSLNQVLNDEFFNAYIPPVLPTSCCVEAPKFKMSSAMLTRRPERMDASCGRTEENKCIVSSMSTLNIALESSPKAVPVSMDVTPSEVSAPTKRTALVRRETSAADSTPESRLSRSQSLKDNLQCLSKRETKMATRSRTKLATAVSNEKLTMGTVSQSNPSSGYESTSTSSSSQCQSNPQSSDQGPVTGNACKTPMFNHVVVVTLRMQESIKQCLRVMPADVCCNPSPRKGPQPVFISKWIDYSNKYGFGFQLSDKSVGVMFNDNTRIACSGDRRRVEFWDSEGGLSIFNQGNVPQPLEERYTLLRYFAKYMDENLTEGGGHGAPARADVPMATNGAMNGSSCVSTIPHMRCWIRSSAAIIMHLSDGTVQINFFKDHTKVVISATDDAEDFVPRPTVLITFINSQRSSSTYDIASLTLRGCEPILRERLVFASSALEQITPLKEKQV